MDYVPHTEEDRRAMLKAIGAGSIEVLFADIPGEIRLKEALSLPAPLTEPELARHMRRLSAKNVSADDYVCFLGAGAYDHFIPAVVDHILLRSEFYTAYTPYQAEISQGVLQSIYEYQSLICILTGMDVANASMYDGASALAEAALMAGSVTRRSKVVIAGSVHPEYRETVNTYARCVEFQVVEVPFGEDGGVDPARVAEFVDSDTACLIVQQPNFFGCLEHVDELSRIAHSAGALFVTAVDPISLGVLKAPGDYGADIVVGEGQALGNPLNFGGPYLGFFAARKDFVRRMPGRIAGVTADGDGNRGFVLTLQTREQHIRRERATSNICSNEALCALAAAVYLTTLGKKGLAEVARQSLQKAHYARERICSLPGFKPAFSGPFFKEFAVRCPEAPRTINQRLLARGIIGGYELGRAYPGLEDCLLFCVTEKRTRAEIDGLVAGLEDRE
ncbi:MAG: aminomethyl-transferring glycine dehydrogenase subunit GcvPA [Bacillota bacterium]